eukprot:1521860-Pleurochrysis_carterae.AAC.1
MRTRGLIACWICTLRICSSPLPTFFPPFLRSLLRAGALARRAHRPVCVTNFVARCMLLLVVSPTSLPAHEEAAKAEVEADLAVLLGLLAAVVARAALLFAVGRYGQRHVDLLAAGKRHGDAAARRHRANASARRLRSH